MRKLSVVLLEDNEELVSKVQSRINLRNDIYLAAKSDDGYEGAVLIEKLKPDLVILDIILPGIDGFAVLDCICKMERRPKVLVASALSHEYFINKALNMGADYYMVKPFEADTMLSRLTELVTQNSVAQPAEQQRAGVQTTGAAKKSLEERIAHIFITVGIPANIKGYHFLREAIKMSIEHPEIINSITKKLYPGIAEKYMTTASKVERAIRHAIEVAWNRGKIENINNIFGLKVYYSNEKPTNGEFIALLADKIILENYNAG